LVKPGGTVVQGTTLPTSPDLGLIWNGAPMHSTLKLRESDPHDDFAIAPDVVPASWADKVLADITRDAKSPSRSPASDLNPPAGSSAAASAVVPKVDTTFRATADVHVPHDRPVAARPSRGRVKKTITVFLFALCSAFAAAGWQHYGTAAKQMISAWTPPFVLTSLPPTENTGPDAPGVEAAAADQAPPPNPIAAQPSDATAPVAAAADAEQLQAMARDLAAMGQEIQLLKASLAELKVSQQTMAIAKPSEVKPAEVKPSAPNPRPKVSALPPRPAAAPLHRPMPAYPAYPPVQTAAPPPFPQAAPPPGSLQPAPPPQATTDPDGEPVVRPPMPLH
jgi:hypothetical protein